jgi:type IV secretion system protein VirB1
MRYVVQPCIAETAYNSSTVIPSERVFFSEDHDLVTLDSSNLIRIRKRVFVYFSIALLTLLCPDTAHSKRLSDVEFGNFVKQCAPAVPEQTLAAVARTESGFDPLALHDNSTGISEIPLSARTAFSDAAAWISRGDSVDVGLMQINSSNFSALGMSVQAALDPCASLAGGAAVLQAAYGGGRTGADQQVALLMALSRYNTGSPFKGIMNGYARRVMASADGADLLPPREIGFQTLSSDPNAPPSWDISATGAYAQSHGASWLISLGTLAAAGESVARQTIPAAVPNPRAESIATISTTQQEARSP